MEKSMTTIERADAAIASPSPGGERPARKPGRPRKHGAKPGEIDARERLMQTASELFCRYGINATGVDAVVKGAGTAKTTLYSIFGSKERLVEAVLEREGETWREWFLGRLDAHPGGAADMLVGIFDILESWFAEERFFGCPFINAVGESAKKGTRIRDLTIAHKTIVLARIRELAAEAGCADPDEASHEIGSVDGWSHRGCARHRQPGHGALCAGGSPAHRGVGLRPACRGPLAVAGRVADQRLRERATDRRTVSAFMASRSSSSSARTRR